MKKSSYLTLLGKFEHSDSWGFGDAFELLCDHTNVLANAFDSGRDGFEKIDTALRDVWTTIEDSISDGKIRVKGGKLIDLSEGLMLTKNPNKVVVDKKSFLSWYRRDKQKIVQYLSYAGLEIHQEEFLDRLASVKQPSKGGRPLFPYKENVKRVVEKILERRPNITQGKVPFMPEVVNVFAPNKGEEMYPDMPAKEYKEQCGCSISTIRKIVREVYKSRS